MKNAFTVDLEDWYQGVALPMNEWHKYEKRLRIGFDRLMNLLDKHKVKATFYVLAKIIEEHPDIIQEIIDEGHEIGSHTYSHQMIYEMTPESFDKEMEQCVKILQDKFGIPYTGFRAPYFSIDERSWWALDVLKKHGFDYDSSIYPGDNKRTGIEGYPQNIHRLENGMTEVPVTTFKVGNYEVGSGGAFFRILPYFYFKRKFKSLNDAGLNGIFYIHPWELDPDHPKLDYLVKRVKYPHYFNLKSTVPKLEKLLSDFEFGTMGEILKLHEASTGIKGV